MLNGLMYWWRQKRAVSVLRDSLKGRSIFVESGEVFTLKKIFFPPEDHFFIASATRPDGRTAVLGYEASTTDLENGEFFKTLRSIERVIKRELWPHSDSSQKHAYRCMNCKFWARSEYLLCTPNPEYDGGKCDHFEQK